MNKNKAEKGDDQSSEHEHHFVSGKFLPFCTEQDCYMVCKEGEATHIDAAPYIENEEAI